MYSNFTDYMLDAESLVTRDSSFDYVEGFVFVNSDDPVNGWPSVFFDPQHQFDPTCMPKNVGPVSYCLEVALHYKSDDHPSTVDKVIPIKFIINEDCFILLDQFCNIYTSVNWYKLQFTT